ncbi:hypothetical protein D3H34_15350 [Acidovorax cavernicola]|uniref:Uncharacterized protein n=1 Tax=Acidovorax cavernicola TaxID=1675792 RepID=A0A9X8D4Q7_9BURK|nr:hypothetical protein D3H34_15350 [Acidovorax cavernicola]
MDTSVKYFTSAMANAPVLSGTVGSMIALLDACLKDGFDTKTLTSLVVVGGVATATYTGTHASLVDGVVQIAGVTGGPAGFAGLNGEQKITGMPGATTRTFATALPDGTYTGTITMKVAPAGWLKPFSGTNLAAYKSADVASTGMLLRVDDTATTQCRVIGYEAMSDVNTGAGPFPTTAQISGGGYWPKSTVATSAPVAWVLVADGRTFLIHIAPGLPQSPSFMQGCTRGFGDAIALKPGGDAFACFLSHSVQPGSASMYDSALDGTQASGYAVFPRSFAGVGSAAQHFCLPYTGQNILSGADSTFGSFPSLVDGSLKLSRRYFATTVTTAPPRADCPGLVSSPQTLLFDSFRMNDRIPGAGAFAGRTLVALNPTQASMSGTPTTGNTGASFVDVTGPWR